MNMPAVLSGILATTGASIFPLLRPADSQLPALAFKTISDNLQDKNHKGAGSLHLARVQITHVADSMDGLQTLLNQVQTLLEGNKTDFSASLSSSVHIEDKEPDAEIYTGIVDYMVQYHQ